MGNLLEVWNLSKSFGTSTGGVLEVLRGITFRVNGGDAIAITGATGAGKSTLLQLVGGLDASDAGKITLNGFNVNGSSSGQLAKFRAREVGFVFQASRLLSDLTAVENVALALAIDRIGPRQARTRAREVLEGVGLGEKLNDAVGHLSGGEQQRVALARALVRQPNLVLADEPTGNLDAETGAKIGELLIDHSHKRNAIVMIATHDLDLAKRCDRRLELKDGRLA